MPLNPDDSTQRTSAKHVSTSPILYPDERLVALLNRRYPLGSRGGLNALDIGFGSGRHIRLLHDMGFNAHGIEYTNEAVEATKTVLGTGSDARLWLGDYRTFEFPLSFDVIVAWGLIVHSARSAMAADLTRIADLLVPQGRLFLNFRTRDNWFVGLGEPIEADTWLLDSRAGQYSGYAYSFVDEPDVRQLAAQSGLVIHQLERLDLWKNNLTERNSWLICELGR